MAVWHDWSESGTWYLDFITELADELDIATDPEDWWQERSALGYVRRFNNFLRDVILTEIREQVVIFIDEIDTTLRLPFSDDFFAAIRATYNARASDPAFAFDNMLSGYESNGTSWSPAMVSKVYNPNGSGTVPPPLGHADVISVRRAFGVSVPILDHPATNPPGNADLQIPPGSGLQQSNIVLASDCTSGAVFQITADPGSGNVDLL